MIPLAEPSSVRLGARGVVVGAARLRRLARRAVVDTRHPLASFDDRDGAAEGDADPVSASAGDARWDPVDGARRRNATEADAVLDARDRATADSAVDQTHWPWWVHTLNRALESYPAFVLLGFVLVDMGSALALLALITRFNVAVDADFALAYALSKSVRAPRLALDAAVAARLARLWPALAAVRVGPILDAGIELGAGLRARAGALASAPARWPFFRGADARAAVKGAESAEEGSSSGASSPDAPRRESRSRRAAREARAMTDAYGLAYMTAKNIIGPTSIAAIYAALKYGVDFSSGAFAWFGGSAAGGATAAAGKTAGALALASWISTLFFPLVVLGAGFLGEKMGRTAERVARFARERERE